MCLCQIGSTKWEHGVFALVYGGPAKICVLADDRCCHISSGGDWVYDQDSWWVSGGIISVPCEWEQGTKWDHIRVGPGHDWDRDGKDQRSTPPVHLKSFFLPKKHLVILYRCVFCQIKHQVGTRCFVEIYGGDASIYFLAGAPSLSLSAQIKRQLCRTSPDHSYTSISARADIVCTARSGAAAFR